MKTKIDQIVSDIKFKYVNQNDIANNNIHYKLKNLSFIKNND